MKQTYYVSPIVPFFFTGVIVLYVLLTESIQLNREWFLRQMILVGPMMMLSLSLWFNQILSIENENLIRRGLFLKRKNYPIADIVSMKEENGKSIYGVKAIKIRFKNNEFINVFGLSTKNMKDFISRIRAVVPEAVDSSVDDFIKKPY